MTRARSGPSTKPCGRAEAASRLEEARANLDLAELSTVSDPSAARKAAASAAVMAGIAAADAACCKALGVHSTSRTHSDAVGLLAKVVPGGDEAAKKLARLLAQKHAVQYDLNILSGSKLSDMQKWARALVEFATEVQRR